MIQHRVTILQAQRGLASWSVIRRTGTFLTPADMPTADRDKRTGNQTPASVLE